VQRLTKEPQEDVVPSWSRDGEWVYFSSNRGGSWQIWKVNVASLATKQVTSNGGFAAVESFDGRHIYYAKSRSMPGLWRMPVGGGSEQLVTDRVKAAMWGYWALSKSGLYFVDKESGEANYALYFLPTGGVPARVTILDKPPILADLGLSATADGRSVLYAQVDQSGSDILLMENPSNAQ
jgi:Tol biopolymer transport system component